jgi:Tfp pilus assembly protein PilN
MKDSRVMLLGLLFFLFCGLLIGGVYFLDVKLTELQEEFDALEQRRVDLNQATRSLMERKTVFSEAFAALENYKINAAPSDVRFYEDVQRVVQAQGLNLLSTRELGGVPGGRSAMTLSVRGDYYAFMQTLAGWRNTPTTMRVSAFSVTSPHAAATAASEQGEIEATVTVEAIVSAPAAK